MYDSDNAFLRHALATLAYRGGKTFRNAPASFASFRAGTDGRTALEIASHLGDLLDWSAELADGGNTWRTATPGSWSDEHRRFHAALLRLDRRFAAGRLPEETADRLFQGPIADALTHVGQLAMMRRMAGAPIVGENYFVAAIRTGEVGIEQAAPVAPFSK